MNLSFLNTPREEKDAPSSSGNGMKLILPPPPKGGGGDSVTKSSGDDDSTLGTPRSIKTKDEFDDPDLDDVLDPDGKQKTHLFGAFGKFMNKQAKAFVKNFVDYGPPYTKKPFDASLVTECSRPVMNHLELHRLLNNRLDPNIPDPDDLYYFPIHWAARNIHFTAMKMLRRAGAKVNVTNELGCSPLDMCVMMKLPPDKRKDQLKMVRYLLENGADPNNRDKGGYSAIDQAAVNQDLEIIQMLLEFGANVLRENHTLVAKRHHILRNVYEPEVYKVLYEQLLLEQGEYEQRQLIREKLLSEVAAERHHVKLFQALDKRKQKRLDREKSRDQTAKLTVIMEQRHKHLQEEMEANLKNKEKAVQFQGTWTKDDVDHWTFKVKDTPDRVNSDVLYRETYRTMNSLAEKNNIDKFNERWKAATGQTGYLELNWTKADPFLLPPIPDAVANDFDDISSVHSAHSLGFGGSTGSVKSKGVSKSSKQSIKSAIKAGSLTGSGSNVSASSKIGGVSGKPPLKSGKITDNVHFNDSGSQSSASKSGILKSGAHLFDTNHNNNHFSPQSSKGSATSLTPSTSQANSQVQNKYIPVKTSCNAAEYVRYDRDGIAMPIVDVKYANEDDEKLYDEDLDEMLRELTTF